MKFRIGNAERLGPLHNTSDYTFRHEYSAGPRWLLVGDASGFLDPIFSTGVMIAMTTGRIAVRTLLRADAQNRALTAREQKTYTRRIYAKMDVFIRMIRAFYDDDAFEVFMQSGASLWRIPEAVTSLVAGHTHSDFGMWWRIKLFFLACWIQKHVALAPRIPSLRAASSTSS
ncbi:MAG: tryptophan 7-halogenase [Verrucomicrobiae bacterium]|nr:tryptophan 7-halogenase [Verrucomicrobiae bacterium]